MFSLSNYWYNPSRPFFQGQGMFALSGYLHVNSFIIITEMILPLSNPHDPSGYYFCDELS